MCSKVTHFYFCNANIRALHNKWKTKHMLILTSKRFIFNQCIRGHIRPYFIVYRKPFGCAFHTEVLTSSERKPLSCECPIVMRFGLNKYLRNLTFPAANMYSCSQFGKFNKRVNGVHNKNLNIELHALNGSERQPCFAPPETVS